MARAHYENFPVASRLLPSAMRPHVAAVDPFPPPPDGYRDQALDRSSDALCTALQLTNFWQDFSRDWPIGRLYVPRDVVVACRAREMDLNGPLLNDAWTAVLSECVERTRAQFEAGRAV